VPSESEVNRFGRVQNQNRRYAEGDPKDMVLRKRRKKGRKQKLSLKKAAQAIAKMVYKHLVKLPEEERERDIAMFEREVSKKLKKLAGRKRSR